MENSRSINDFFLLLFSRALAPNHNNAYRFSPTTAPRRGAAVVQQSEWWVGKWRFLTRRGLGPVSQGLRTYYNGSSYKSHLSVLAKFSSFFAVTLSAVLIHVVGIRICNNPRVCVCTISVKAFWIEAVYNTRKPQGIFPPIKETASTTMFRFVSVMCE